MAELADALDLGSSSERSTGSIPASRTKKRKLRQSHNTMYYHGKIVAFSFRTGCITDFDTRKGSN